MPVDFDRYMVGYAASAYLDDAFDRYATLFRKRPKVVLGIKHK